MINKSVQIAIASIARCILEGNTASLLAFLAEPGNTVDEFVLRQVKIYIGIIHFTDEEIILLTETLKAGALEVLMNGSLAPEKHPPIIQDFIEEGASWQVLDILTGEMLIHS